MSGKKHSATPQLLEFPPDEPQAVLTSCSTATISTSAGRTTGYRPPTGSNNYPKASPPGCKRSVNPMTYHGPNLS